MLSEGRSRALDPASHVTGDVQVIWHTPFSTERLDERRLTAASLDVLEKAADELNGRNPGAGWRPCLKPCVRVQSYADPLKATIEAKMPRPFLTTSSSMMLGRLRDPDPSKPRASGPNASKPKLKFDLTEPRLTLWTIGAGVLTSTYNVTAGDGTTWAELVSSAAKRHSAAREPRNACIRELLEGFEAVARARGWVQDWPRGGRPLWSEALWTYESFAVTLPSATPDVLASVARALAEDGPPWTERHGAHGTVFRTGFTACSVTSATTSRSHDRLKGLIDTQTACWASAVALESFVADQLLALRFGDRLARELETEAITLLRLTDKTRFFLTTFEATRTHLKPGDGVLWEFVDTSWKFSSLRAGLAGRLDALREVHREMTERANARRLQTASTSNLMLAIVGAIASILAIGSFIFG